MMLFGKIHIPLRRYLSKNNLFALTHNTLFYTSLVSSIQEERNIWFIIKLQEQTLKLHMSNGEYFVANA